MSNSNYRFLVIGAGGIGSWLSEGLVRMLEYRAPNSALVIVDGDIFESKNKERQNFETMGNKADVLAAKLAPQFNQTLVIPIPMWVVEETAEDEDPEYDEDGVEQAGKIAAKDLISDGDVIYAVVDNFKARKTICDAARNLDNVDVFLGGNGSPDDGEGLFCSIYHYQRRDGKDVTEHPADIKDEYANPKDRNPGELSCAERAELDGGTQLIAANFGVTAFLLGQTQARILDNEPISDGEIYVELGKGLALAHERLMESESVSKATVATVS